MPATVVSFQDFLGAPSSGFDVGEQNGPILELEITLGETRAPTAPGVGARSAASLGRQWWGQSQREAEDRVGF